MQMYKLNDLSQYHHSEIRHISIANENNTYSKYKISSI